MPVDSFAFLGAHGQYDIADLRHTGEYFNPGAVDSLSHVGEYFDPRAVESFLHIGRYNDPNNIPESETGVESLAYAGRHVAVADSEFVTRWSQRLQIDEAVGVTRWSSSQVVEGEVCLTRWTALPPKNPAKGNVSSFVYATRTGDDTPTLSLSGPTGIENICPHTVTVSGRESQTSTLNIQLSDTDFSVLPYGDGALKDLMADGAEVTAKIGWGGVEKPFEAIMKSPSGSQDGPNKPCELTWPGTGHSRKLFKSKKDLETLGAIGQTTGLTNLQILEEMCGLVGLNCRALGIRQILIGGPYHRQQLKPGEVAGQVLDLTVDNWRDEGRTLEWYDSESIGQIWDYTHDNQVIHQHTFAPMDNDTFSKVVALRAIAAGRLFPTNETTDYEPLDNFGVYTVSLPNLNGVTFGYAFRDWAGAASDFYYQTALGLVARNVRPDSTPRPEAIGGPIIDATSVEFTWGAANQSVTAQGITSALGGIHFYGSPNIKATVGNQPPTDMTTRKVSGSGDDCLELSSTPLISNGADLQFLADKTRRLVGYPIVNHTLVVPLNQLIKVGDAVRFRAGELYGGGLIGPFEVIGYQHVARRKKTESRTTLSLREFVGR